MKLKDKIGTLLKSKRTNKGYSYQNVADLLGVNKSSIFYYEDGSTSVPIEKLEKLCTIYDTDIYSFFEELKNV